MKIGEGCLRKIFVKIKLSKKNMTSFEPVFDLICHLINGSLTHLESLYRDPQTNIEDKGIKMKFIPPPPMPPLSSMPLSSMPMQMPMSMDGYPLYPVHTPPSFQSIPMSMPMPVRETPFIFFEKNNELINKYIDTYVYPSLFSVYI